MRKDRLVIVFRSAISRRPACPAVDRRGRHAGLITGNVIADNANVGANESIEKKYPGGNLFTRSYNNIGFVDYVHGQWQLATNSKYRGKATDAKDPGVNFAALEASGVRFAKEGLPTGSQ